LKCNNLVIVAARNKRREKRNGVASKHSTFRASATDFQPAERKEAERVKSKHLTLALCERDGAPFTPREGAVANRLNLYCNGAIGFIAGLAARAYYQDGVKPLATMSVPRVDFWVEEKFHDKSSGIPGE
jgi:hypothetical protein